MSFVNKIFDRLGNEVKSGMTIYFVRTKPISFGRLGIMMPSGDNGRPTEIWESDEEKEKRENEEIWDLGQSYFVSQSESRWVITSGPDEDGYTYTFPLLQEDNICIKGISDTKNQPT